MRRRLRWGSAVLAGLVLVAGVLTLIGDRTGARVAPAADITQFNPGNIISDAVFFNAAAMNAADVNAFIQAKGLGCRAGSDGTPCLGNFWQDTAYRAGDSYCSGYTSAAHESAATIITKVAAACGINPQVLLVIMQKEQGLLTDSGSSLYASRYRIAMGYGCPDTAACDTTYYGFQNQVYAAARQYRRYAANPDSFGYHVGRTSNILWNPNSACGSSAVYVQNQATAGLYNYTPYQPNAAALAAGYGTGNSCSAYGNRNFWLYFTDWFGSTQGPDGSAWNPIGSLDTPVVVSNRIATVSGWAADPDDLSAAETVHVYVDSSFVTAVRADQYDADISGNHAFTTQMPLTPGGHTVCTYGINVGRGGNALLGCTSVTVPTTLTSAPTGVESARADGRFVDVAGWALDPDALATPIAVHVYADGVGAAILQAGQAGAPTDTYFPGAGPAHGYSAQLSLGAGSHNVCAYGINVGAGTVNQLLGCTTVAVDKAAFNPIGSWDTMTQDHTTITVTGWAEDLDSTTPNQVHVYVDGSGVAILTPSGANPTVDGHGFRATVPLGVGVHTVCLYNINVGEGSNTNFGCRGATVAASDFNPVGSLDSVTATGGTVQVSGRATDPDIPDAAVTVPVYVDGQGVAIVSAAGPYPGADGHGYTASFVLADGPHTVCTYGINAGQGTTNVLLGCRSVTVSSHPVGSLDAVVTNGSHVTVSGWATDPDTTGSILVPVYVDGQGMAVLTANGASAVASGHGYSATLTLPEGAHTVCTYGLNVGPGSNALLACRQFTVSSNPSGTFAPVIAIGGKVSVSGWAVDPDTTGPILVPVYVDGQGVAVLTADQANASQNGHGYAGTLTLAAGTHTVCTYGINVGAGTTNVLLGCQTITVSSNPSGALDPVTVARGQVSVSGWAADPDSTNPILVPVYVDGQGTAVLTADQASAVDGGHGYSAQLALAAGAHTVCSYGINVGAGTTNVLLGCRAVTVP